MAQQNYSVKGKITNWPGDFIFLETNGNVSIKDSVKNVDGSFEFKGTINGVSNAFLVNKAANEPAYKFFFLAPADIHIEGSYEDLSNAKVSGSKFTTEYQEIQNIHNVKKNKVDSLYNLADLEKNKDKSQIYFNEIEKLNKIDLEASKDFISNKTNNPAVIYELSSISLKVDYPSLQSLFDKLDPELKESKQALDFKTYLTNLGNIQIGKLAPNFSQPDSSSKIIQLSDFKGKYVLLDFWASWCVPCRRENPNLLQAYKQYKDKGFEIFGVSIDTKDEDWRWKRAIQNDGLIWTQVSDLKGPENDAAKLYAIQVIPSNYLIDPSGKIIATNLMGEELNKKLQEIFETK